ncbi:hypothetical protein [Thermococcus sp.]|uniref:hypothetical protein n=1 Tax=Thermococcus sp. TaxID=35749 RepID=UPI00260E5BBD|nr:hypothetical protein [Thermococcus sp.]
MRLEQALKEYEKRKRKATKEREGVERKHNKRMEKLIKELIRRIDTLERRDIPKDVDGNIRKIVTAERRNYVTALRNALNGINDMESLGKRLPDLAKLHVGHGKYLLIIFEKDVYAINRLLKELNEEYMDYYNELAEKGLEEVNVEEIMGEIEKTREDIKRTEEELRKLKRRLSEAEIALEEFYHESGLEEIEREAKALRLKVKGTEMEVRSKASKLQKPVKRMRLGEEIAEELVHDSSIALREPEKFLRFVRKIEPKLDPKQRKAARWLLENLPRKVEELNYEKKKLEEIENHREDILAGSASIEDEIRRIKSLMDEKGKELKKLKNRLEHLERELEDEIKKLEKAVGTNIER